MATFKVKDKETGKIFTIREKEQENNTKKTKASIQNNTEGLNTTAKKILPTFITGAEPKSGERTLLGNLFERPGAAVRAGIRGLKPGGETPVQAFSRASVTPENEPTFQQQFLETGVPQTESVLVNFLGGLPASTLGLAVDMATNPADLLTTLLGNAPVKGNIKTAEKSVKSISDKYFVKAVTPSSRNIRSFKDINKFKTQAATAIESVLDNAGELQFIDDATGKIVNRLPENLDEFSSAIRQSKKKVFQKYDAMKSTANETGAKVNLKPIADDLVESVSNSAVQELAPNVQSYVFDMAEKLEKRGNLGLSEAQDWVELLNTRLKSFYANPTPDEGAKRVYDAAIANNIRKQLTNIINSETKGKYSILRNQYGALDTIETDVAKSAFNSAKQVFKGLVDFSDIFTVSEIATGLAIYSPGRIVRGGLGLALKSLYKRMNNPDRMIKTMFQQVSKTKQQNAIGILNNLIKQTKYTVPVSTRSLTTENK